MQSRTLTVRIEADTSQFDAAIRRCHRKLWFLRLRLWFKRLLP